MPYASLIVPTMRIGGMDVLFSGLRNQTSFDFELILVDALYQRRKDILQERTKNFPFTIKHVEPFQNRFPVSIFSHASNTGLCHAAGEIAVLMTDYMLPSSRLIETHIAFHKDNPGNKALSAPYLLCFPPETHKKFKRYYPEEAEKYAQDYQLGALDEFMWSTFNSPVDSHGCDFVVDPRHDIHPGQDHKRNFARGKMPLVESFFYAKNDSIKLDAILSLNGYDEEFDGSHGWQDCELFDRLCMKLETEWYVDPAIPVYNINPRSFFPTAEMPLGGPARNLKLWASKCLRTGIDWERNARPFHPGAYPTVPNNWSLREKRKELGLS